MARASELLEAWLAANEAAGAHIDGLLQSTLAPDWVGDFGDLRPDQAWDDEHDRLERARDEAMIAYLRFAKARGLPPAP